MDNSQSNLNELLAHDFSSMEPKETVPHLGALIDLSEEHASLEGTKKAIRVGEDILPRLTSSTSRSLLYYFLSNAYSNLYVLSPPSPGQDVWAWESPRHEKPLLYLRYALLEPGFGDLPPYRKAQIHTNLANVLNKIGRSLEAIEHYDQALSFSPGFPMATGNKGIALFHIGRALYRHHDHTVYFFLAHVQLQKALERRHDLEEEAAAAFEKYLYSAGQYLAMADSEVMLDDGIYSESPLLLPQESAYRTWCVTHRLFLNPLTDIGLLPPWGGDVFLLPSVERAGEGMKEVWGLFLQISHEFVYARSLLYHGMHAATVLNLQAVAGLEQIKLAFRAAYSIFDKIAYLINSYYGLHRPQRVVNCRTIWKERGHVDLHDVFRNKENWPLRGLYWLTKDLYYEQDEDFKNSLEPEARELRDLRNALEHRYVKILETIPEGYGYEESTIAYCIRRDEFIRKTIKLFKLVRSAIMYLAMAVFTEERGK